MFDVMDTTHDDVLAFAMRETKLMFAQFEEGQRIDGKAAAIQQRSGGAQRVEQVQGGSRKGGGGFLDEDKRANFSDDGNKRELVQFFTQAEGKCSWIPIEAPHKTPSRYMEFFLPSGDARIAAELEEAAAEERDPEAVVRRRKAEELAHQQRQRTKKPCGLCEKEFPMCSMTASVTRQAVLRQRERWGNDGIDNVRQAESKFRLRLYDELPVCMMCWQQLDVYGDNGEAELRKARRARQQAKKRRDAKKDGGKVVVAIVGKARLEEMSIARLVRRHSTVPVPAPPKKKRPSKSKVNSNFRANRQAAPAA